MSELTIKLIIILIPGAIATLIFGKLILHREWNSFKFVLFSTLFGVFSYLLLQLGIELINLFKCHQISDLTIWNNLTDSKNIPFKEVLLSSILATLLAFIMSSIENKKLIYRIAKFFSVSNKYGEENLFSRFLNSKDINWIYVRDIKNNLTYLGWVKSFSETDSLSEIRLGDVEIYEYESSKLLYEVKEVYLSFNKNEIIIEKPNFINIKEDNQDGKKETK